MGEMDIGDLREHLDRRLDSLEEKLDSHLERISKAETNIEWIRGYLRVGVTIAITGVSSLCGIIYHLFMGKGQ
jgi:hypothetical protein